MTTITTPETTEVAAAREALLAAITQWNRFDMAKAIEVFIDAKIAAVLGADRMVEREGDHPMDVERAEHKERREAQLARLAAAEDGASAPVE